MPATATRMEPSTAGRWEGLSPENRMQNRAVRPGGALIAQAGLLLLLAALYLLAAKAGLRLASVAAQVPVIWPASGTALAAVLLLGRRAWPAIWLGAFVANLTSHAGPAASILIACGNTGEALAGAWLLQRIGF